uniref:Uncharacterized protein n=1 Tax=Acrobeloides nanus TaxID=290746 RepID=A0A914EMC2_9BILA
MKNPNLKIPSESEIRYWYEIFKRKGSFENEAKLAKEVRKDLNSVDLHTTIYEKETGILNFFGFKKFHKCHPYKMHLKHQLDNFQQLPAHCDQYWNNLDAETVKIRNPVQCKHSVREAAIYESPQEERAKESGKKHNLRGIHV